MQNENESSKKDGASSVEKLDTLVTGAGLNLGAQGNLGQFPTNNKMPKDNTPHKDHGHSPLPQVRITCTDHKQESLN
jgi:hypothetical protein